MKKKLSIGLKISGGFALLLVVIILLGLISLYSIKRMVENNNQAVSMLENKEFITAKLNDHLSWLQKLDNLFLYNIAFDAELNPQKCGFGIWYYEFIKSEEYTRLPKEMQKIIDDMEHSHTNLHQSAKEITSCYTIYDDHLSKFLVEKELDHMVWVDDLIHSCCEKIKFSGQLNHTQCSFGKWYYNFLDTKTYENLREAQKITLREIDMPHRKLHDSGKEILSLQEKSMYDEAMAVYLNRTTPILRDLRSNFGVFKSDFDTYYTNNARAKEILHEKTAKSIDELTVLFGAYRKYLDKSYHDSLLHAAQNQRSIILFLIVIVSISLILGVILSIVITGSITKPLKFITDKVLSSSTQVRSAATGLSKSSQELSSSSQHLSSSSVNISNTSQQIATGASQQAASVEETTSSLEELTSIVSQNAINAREAATQAKNAKDLSNKGYSEMEVLYESMDDLSKSSDKIKKVIKVIEDIAFQTNILALNAAVEAAKAGEAGMGFSVVADEVKNLANKSAVAAKESADMIEDSLEKCRSGVDITTRLRDVFKNIVESINKVSEVAKEVEIASDEQSKGLDQVSKAIIQFDNVVQSNAASSEELAGSSEELAGSSEQLVTNARTSLSSAGLLLSQATTLGDIVSQLSLVVTGKALISGNDLLNQPVPQTRIPVVINNTIIEEQTGDSVILSQPEKKIQIKETTPAYAVIPFDHDEEFRE